jgi:hypothetical protein
MDIYSNLNRETRDLIHRIGKLQVKSEKLTILRWLATDLQLAAAELSDGDRLVLDQAAALEAIRAVAIKLDKPLGEWPTVREFDKHTDSGITSERVRRLFGRWRTAIRELNGGFTQATHEQRAYRRTVAGRDYDYEDPETCIDQWLDTQPVVENRDAYNSWARGQNKGHRGGRGFKPSSATIIQRLGLPFREIVRIRKGEIAPEEATRSSGLEKPTFSKIAGHVLIGRPEIAKLLGIDYQRVRRLESDARYPRPVLVLGNTSAWLRDDVLSYHAGRERPARETNAFRLHYLNASELAARHGVTPAALRQKNAHAPAPDGAVCGKHIWYLPHVELWEADNPPPPNSGRRRLQRASE